MKEGFCWIDVNSTYLKARIKANGVFDVLSMSLFTMTNLPDWYYVALINSEFISLYVDNFINNTSHFQINDARQLPIIIPQKEAFESLQKIVADCISLKRTAVIDEILMEEKQYDLDRLVRSFYGVRVCRNTRFTLFSLSTIRALLTFSSSDILKIISIFCSQ